MFRRFCIRTVLLSGFVAGLGSAAPAQGGFLATLSATETPQGGGTFLFSYTLTVEPSSTSGASVLAIGVPSNVSLASVQTSTGWDITYGVGDSEVDFESAPGAPDIAPGSSGTFSFVSPVGPASNSFAIFSFDSSSSVIGEVDGTILSPVPEPSSMVLCGLGVLGLGAYWRRSRRAAAGV